MYPLYPFVLEAPLAAESTRRCADCGAAVRADDGFGLSERICSSCRDAATRLRSSRPRRRRAR